MINNLPNDVIVPGQVLKLPISTKAQTTTLLKNQVEDLHKNTNSHNYRFEDCDSCLNE